MKLVRFGEPGNERPGVLVEEPGASPMILDVRGMAYDLEDYNEDFSPVWHGAVAGAAVGKRP